MTSSLTAPFDMDDRLVFGDPSTPLEERPTGKAWYAVACTSLVLAFVEGYGAFYELYALKPTLYMALQFVLLSSVVFLAPRRTVQRVFFPLPFIAFMVWWMASYLWSSFKPSFLVSNIALWAGIGVVLVLGGMLPTRDVVRCLLISGYVSIGLVFYALLVKPDVAFRAAGDGVAAPGLKGAFNHKSPMAACLLVTLAAVLCFEHRRWVRVTMLVAVGVMVFLSGSSSGVSTFVLLLVLNWLIERRHELRSILGRAYGPLGVFAGVGFVLTVVVLAGAITRLFGKDLTFTGRTDVWGAVVAQIQARPLLLGWGGYDVWFFQAADPARAVSRETGFIVHTAHNGILETLLRLGLVGVGLYFWQYFSTLRNANRLLDDSPRLGRFVLLMMLVITMIGFSESLTTAGLWFAVTVLFSSPKLPIAGYPSAKTPVRRRLR